MLKSVIEVQAKLYMFALFSNIEFWSRKIKAITVVLTDCYNVAVKKSIYFKGGFHYDCHYSSYVQICEYFYVLIFIIYTNVVHTL